MLHSPYSSYILACSGPVWQGKEAKRKERMADPPRPKPRPPAPTLFRWVSPLMKTGLLQSTGEVIASVVLALAVVAWILAMLA